MILRHRRLTAGAALTSAASLSLPGFRTLAACGADTPDPAPSPSSETAAAGSSPAAQARALAPGEAEAADPSARPADSAPKSEESGESVDRAELVVSEIRVGDHGGE